MTQEMQSTTYEQDIDQALAIAEYGELAPVVNIGNGYEGPASTDDSAEINAEVEPEISNTGDKKLTKRAIVATVLATAALSIATYKGLGPVAQTFHDHNPFVDHSSESTK